MKNLAWLSLLVSLAVGCANHPQSLVDDPFLQSGMPYSLLLQKQIPVGTPVDKAISILSSGGFQCSFQTGDILISVADGNRSQSSSVSCVVTNETGSLVHAEWLPELVVQDGKVSMAVSITQRSRKD